MNEAAQSKWLFSRETDLTVFLGSAVVSLLLLAVGWQLGILNDESPDWTDGVARENAGHHAVEFRVGPLAIYAVANSVENPGYAVIRAEEVLLSLEPQASSSARNHFRGRITEISTLGALTRVSLDVDGVPVAAVSTFFAGSSEIRLRSAST